MYVWDMYAARVQTPVPPNKQYARTIVCGVAKPILLGTLDGEEVVAGVPRWARRDPKVGVNPPAVRRMAAMCEVLPRNCRSDDAACDNV
jgi:hypothetical protein